MVCILAGTGVFTENSALILARMGSLQLKWEWVNMSSVLSEGALVQHSSVAAIRKGTETAALLVGSRVFPCLWVLHFSSRFFTYAGSSEKWKSPPTLQTSQGTVFLRFLQFLHFCTTEIQQKSYTVESLGATGKCWKLPRDPSLWPLQMGPLLHLLSNFLFQNKTRSKLLLMCRAWQQENMRALGHLVQLPAVSSEWGRIAHFRRW